MMNKDPVLYLESAEKQVNVIDFDVYTSFNKFGKGVTLFVRLLLFLNENEPLLLKCCFQARNSRTF